MKPKKKKKMMIKLAHHSNTRRKRRKVNFNLMNKILLFALLIILIVVLWIYSSLIQCCLAFIYCYVTWPIVHPEHLQLDLSLVKISTNRIDENSSKSNNQSRIPRRLHHIVLGPLSRSIPSNWLKSRNSCLELHSNFDEFHFWTDENSEKFLLENYFWFLSTWKSYSTFVQKADALRYFVLFHYGGIFLDMDLYCRRSLNYLLEYLDERLSNENQTKENDLFFAVKAFPVGISNGFLISTKSHRFLRQVVSQLEYFHRNFLFPHATIVISTGPMFLSIQIQLNLSLRRTILILDGKENMLGGKRRTPLFDHFGSGSWHRADETFFKNIPQQIHHQSTSIILFPSIILILMIWRKTNRCRNCFAFSF